MADPDRRELHISLGCALENFLIAAERFGFGHEVVYPAEGEGGAPAASVTLLAEGAPSTCRPAELFETIVTRATHRGPYERRPVPEDAALAQLRECVADDGVGLFLTDDPEIRAPGAGARRARRPAALLGSGLATRAGGVGRRGGLRRRAAAGPGLTPRPELARPGRGDRPHDAAALASTPIVGLLYSASDDRESRIRVGQAFERLTLMAARRGLSTQPLSQLVELPDIRRSLQALLPDREAYPQHPFRLGYARAAARPTPRRPVGAVLA